jgi:hypothetical protein
LNLFRVENDGQCASTHVLTHVLTFKMHFYDILTAYITIVLLYMRAIGNNSHCAVTGASSKSIWKIAHAKPTVTALGAA